MNLKEFVKEEIPKRCGVHPAFGVVAEMIYNEELLGNKEFAAENFKTTRERAKLALPFKPNNIKEYERCLDIIELILLLHAEKHHGVDNKKDIMVLEDKLVLSTEESKMIASEWWNG